jgi:hypothetical protein
MAKKRHHQSVRSRENEAAGMARYEARSERRSAGNHMNVEYYNYDIGARPMRERHPSMISDDMRAPSNLPQHVMEKYWPTSYNGHNGYVEDAFYGVQRQLKEDYDDFGREMGPRKY